MAEQVQTYSRPDIGIGTFRFNSGVPIPSASDLAVDPYAPTRTTKTTPVEGQLFWPQEKKRFPALFLLHDRYGLTEHAKEIAIRLACEGYAVCVPNLYSRQGGTITANAEVAEVLMTRVQEAQLLQDLTTACDFLNMRDYVKQNVFGVIGMDLGATIAIRFGCLRRRLRGVVSFYGRFPAPDVLKNLQCPLLYHHAEAGGVATAEQLEQLRQGGTAVGKPVEIKTYDGAPLHFFSQLRKDFHRQDLAEAAWASTVAFLADCFKADRT